MGVPMRALARQTYDGRALKSGDEFEATSEDEALDLIAVNMAERRTVPSNSANDGEGAAEETSTRAVQPKAQQPAGDYTHRSMKARR